MSSLKFSAGEMEREEARALYRDYLSLVRRRVAMEKRLKSLSRPLVLNSLLKGLKRDEEAILKLLEAWVRRRETGRWLLGITGVGPVVATGLLVHVNLRKMKSVESLWRYAGLDGITEKLRHPYHNPTIKAIAYWAGDSFIRTQKVEGSFYGPLWRQRRDYEEQMNNQGRLKGEAERTLRRGYRWRKKTREMYEAGMLSPSHLSARARRWTVKIFLSHFYEILLWNEWGMLPAVSRTIGPPNDPRRLESGCGSPEQGFPSTTERGMRP